MFKVIFTIGTVQTLAVLVQFIKSKIVAVYLGPAGVGITGTIDQFVQLAAFVSVFGLPAASIKFLSKSHSESAKAFKSNYAVFFVSLLFLSLTGAVLAMGIILLKPDILGAEIEKYKLFLILGLTTLPALTLMSLFVNVFAAAQKFRASSLLILIGNLISSIAATSGVIYGGILGLYIATIIAGVSITIVVIIYFRRKLGLPFYERPAKIRNEFQNNPLIFSTALLLYSSAITAALSYSAARYSVLKNFGEVDAGLLHSVMVLAFAFGTALYPAINIYLNPLVNRSVENTVKINQVLQFQKKLALVLSLAALPIIVFPKSILALMFSEKFADVGQIAYLFVISQFIVQLAGVYQSLLVGLDDVKSYTFITSATQIISAVMCLVLVPIYGISGVAISFLIGNSLNFMISLARLINKYNFFVPLTTIILIVYVLMILTLTGLICNQFAELSFAALVFKAMFMMIFSSSLLLFLSKEEKQQLYHLRRKFFQTG